MPLLWLNVTNRLRAKHYSLASLKTWAMRLQPHLKWVFERSFKERPSRARGSCRSVPCRLHHLASPAGASVTITPSSQLLPAFLAPKLTLIQPGHPAALCCPLLSPSDTDSSGPMLWTRIQCHPKSVLSPLTSACSCELLAALPNLSSGFTDNYLSWLLS